MTIREEQRDLFTLPHGYTLVHCISEDFALGAGIAVQFNERYDMRKRLRKASERIKTKFISDFEGGELSFVGDMIPIDNVINLITKKRAYGKPTYESLISSLGMMIDYVEMEGIKKIGMPRIGCGLDGLEWTKVRAIIEEAFEGLDVEIVVCYL